MTRRPPPRILLALAALLVFLTALFAAACAGNPNEHIEADQYFRQPAPGAQQQDADQAADQGDADQQASTDQQTNQQAGQSTDQPAAEQQQQSSSQAEPAAEDAQSDTQDAPDDQQPAAPPPRADDVLRRYLNPSYGYSLELICPPFCDPTSNGIDRATFLADTGRALLEIRVSEIIPDDQLDDFWRESLAVPEFVETPQREQVELALTPNPGWRYAWDEDRRAMGGFLVRWQATYVQIGGLLYLLRGGAVEEDYEATLPALTRAFDSFIAPIEAMAVPGRYERFDFLFEYATSYISVEYGLPTANPATFDAGIIVLQSTQALNAVLVWEAIGAAFHDPDVAIERTLADALGAEPQSDYRDARTVDGRGTRLALSQTALGEGLVQIASFAWYCDESGREFVLHMLDNDDPEAAADTLLDGFRCQLGGES